MSSQQSRRKGSTKCYTKNKLFLKNNWLRKKVAHLFCNFAVELRLSGGVLGVKGEELFINPSELSILR